MNDSHRLEARIEGQVQGVYFRARARAQAIALGVTGMVRNRADGSVETVAEGARAALEQYAAWLQQGPPQAKVKRVTLNWSEARKDFTRFEVAPDAP